MTIVDEAVAASEDSAASVYDEREYLTQHGSTSGATVDPWDDDATPKDAWVVKFLSPLTSMLAVNEYEIAENAPASSAKAGDSFSKSLNLGRGYAEHWERYSCRELVQNWFDACVERCGGSRRNIRVITTTAPAAGLGLGASGIIYLALHGDVLAGYLADYEDTNGSRTVELVNYGGLITVDAMVLGNSSKRGQSGATGFFGEGVKVEINRLTASGMTVQYKTPIEGTGGDHLHAHWSFSYESEGGGDYEVLHLKIDTVEGHAKGVEVKVTGLPAGYPAIDAAGFLFLQGEYERVVAPPGEGAAVAGIEVLLDPKHEGRIYIGGIFALPWASLKGIGLDYTGGGDSFKHVGLGRDRSSVHVHELIALLPSALAHERGTPQATTLMERIYDTLQKFPHSEMAWIRDIPFDGPLTKQAREWWFEFAADLVALFQEKHGKRACPCESHEMSIMHEAAGMGAVGVVVSFPLKKTLEGSPSCPNMALLRSQFYDSMLAIPDVNFDEANQKHQKIKQLRSAVVRFFDEVKLEKTCFKCPVGNQRLVVPVAGQFIIDFNLIQLDAVHREQAKQGASICLKKDCGCQTLALVRGFTEAIAGADDHVKGKLEQRVMRALIEEGGRKGDGGKSERSTSSRPEIDDAEGSADDSDDNDEEPDSGNDMLALLMSSAVSDNDNSNSDANDSDTDSISSREEAKPQRVGKSRNEVAAATPPLPPQASSANLVCPLTKQPFKDPVVASDGYTYERKAMEKWLDEHDTSPESNLPLESLKLYENRVIKTITGPLSSSSISASLPPPKTIARPKPASKMIASRQDDLDSIYMSRRPAKRVVKPRPSRRAPSQVSGGNDEDDDDSTDNLNEEAFMHMFQGRPRLKTNDSNRSGPEEESRTRHSNQGTKAKKKKNWIFGRK